MVLRVNVNPADVGKVIGRQGRTIQSLRGLLYGLAARQEKRAILDLVEPPAATPPPGNGNGVSPGATA